MIKRSSGPISIGPGGYTIISNCGKRIEFSQMTSSIEVPVVSKHELNEFTDCISMTGNSISRLIMCRSSFPTPIRATQFQRSEQTTISAARSNSQGRAMDCFITPARSLGLSTQVETVISVYQIFERVISAERRVECGH